MAATPTLASLPGHWRPPSSIPSGSRWHSERSGTVSIINKHPKFNNRSQSRGRGLGQQHQRINPATTGESSSIACGTEFRLGSPRAKREAAPDGTQSCVVGFSQEMQSANSRVIRRRNTPAYPLFLLAQTSTSPPRKTQPNRVDMSAVP